MTYLDDLAEQVGRAALRSGRTIAAAESLTGGQVCAALAKAPEASDWLRGGVVAYSSEVKHDLLEVPDGPVVSEASARAMAAGVTRLLGATTAVAVTGVGGPDPQDGQPPGTVWLAVTDRGRTDAALLELQGDPAEICERTCEEALGALLARIDDAVRS